MEHLVPKKVQEVSPERQAGIAVGCPACVIGRHHKDAEWEYHPKAGKGFDKRDAAKQSTYK